MMGSKLPQHKYFELADTGGTIYIYVYKESDLETTHEKHCEYQNYQNENLVEKTNMWKLFQGFVFSFSSVV